MVGNVEHMEEAMIVERTAPAVRSRSPHRLPHPLALDACLELLALAFVDLAARDDIHQAARRLRRVLGWIGEEAERAADDPVFANEAGCDRPRRKPLPAARVGRYVWRTL